MEDKEIINSVNYNQDNGCFIVATSMGIRVFNTNEFQPTFFRGKYLKWRVPIDCIEENVLT